MLTKYRDDLMASPLCGGDAEETTTELRFEFDSVVIVIEGVPALRCVGRDDLLIPGPIGIMLGDYAFEIARTTQSAFAEIQADADELVETRVRLPSRIRDLLPA